MLIYFNPDSLGYAYAKQLQKASFSLALGMRGRRGEVAALVNLYGLRVVAAAEAYLKTVGLKTNASSAWQQLKRVSVGIGEEVNKALDSVSLQLGVGAISHHPDFSTFDEGDLINTIATLDRIDLQITARSDLDLIGEVLESYIEFSEKRDRDFPLMSPTVINKLLAGMLLGDNRDVRSVYDPTCGFGGSLIAVHDALKRSGDADNVKFYGQDITPVTASVTAWRFWLRGVTEFEIAVGDTLLDPSFRNGRTLTQFDCVISVPPIYPTAKQDLTNEDPYLRFSYGGVRKGRADYAFVQHVLASTSPRGRAVTTLALSTLGRSGYERDIRSRLVGSEVLETVLSFPEIVSPQYKVSPIPTGALIFDLNRPKDNLGFVYFVDGNDIETNFEGKPVLTEDAAIEIIRLYTRKSEVTNRAAWVSSKQLAEREFNLLPKLHIPQSPPQPTNVKAIKATINTLNQEVRSTLRDLDLALQEMDDPDF